MPDQQQDLQIVLKVWEMCHGIAKSSGETAWSVRSWGVSIWSALIAYAFTAKIPALTWVAFVVLMSLLVIEIAIRQIQYSYIKRSLELEDALNDVLAGSEMRIIDHGASTNIDTPTFRDFLELLKIKRWLIWFPYLLLALFTFFAMKII
jgi:hypothetical protein